MTAPYAWLSDIRAELSTDRDSQTPDDAQLMIYASQASRRIDNLFYMRRPVFLPYKETKYIPVTASLVNSDENTLRLPGGLLALTSLIAGTTTLTGVEVWPTGASPANKLRLTEECTAGWYSYKTTSTPLLVTIDGIWGFHRDYDHAWDALDTLAANMLIGATTFQPNTVSTYSVGQLIKIGTEYMEVTAVTDSVTDVITVKRAANGTTAAAHALSDPVYVWLVEEPIRRAVAKQAAFMYARQGAYETVTINDISTTQFPADLLGEIYAALQGYAYG